MGPFHDILQVDQNNSGPLNYVIRNDFSPAYGADNPGTNYTSKDTEMIAREPILLELGVGDE